MKRKPLTHAARLLCALALSMSLAPAALAADPSEPTQPSPCYPTAVTRSEDGTEIRKMYDLGPEDDPGGIPPVLDLLPSLFIPIFYPPVFRRVELPSVNVSCR